MHGRVVKMFALSVLLCGAGLQYAAAGNNLPGSSAVAAAATVPSVTTAGLDLALDKRHTSEFVVGLLGTYTFVVRNVGTVPTASTITVVDTLPNGFAFASVSGPGWSMGFDGQVVNAMFLNPIAPGDSASFSLMVSVGPAAIPMVVNSAVVRIAGDVNPANDRDVDPTDVDVFTRGRPASWGGVRSRYR